MRCMHTLLLLLLIIRLACSADKWPADEHDCAPCSCYVGISRTLRLPSAKIVNCADRMYTTIPDHLPHDLEELDLSDNRISQLSSDAMNGYHSIKGLRLRYNNISVLPENVFQNASLLQYLDLEGNTGPMLITTGLFDTLANIVSIKGLVVENLPPNIFQNLPKLRVLSISTYQDILSDDMFQHIALTNLKLTLWNATAIPELMLKNSNMTLRALHITAPNIRAMSENLFRDLYVLQTIHLETSKLKTVTVRLFQQNDIAFNLTDTDAAMFLSGYRHLREITIVGLPTIPKHLFERLPNLVTLTLQQIVDIHAQSFHMLSRLDYLEISFSSITYIDAEWFVHLGGLKELNCSWNKLNIVTDTDLNYLYSLQTLDLSHNDIAWLSENVFGSFKNSLEYLDVSWNNIYHLPLKMFDSMWNLKILLLRNNFLHNLDSRLFTNNIEFINELDLQYNSLTSLPRGLFFGLQDLTRLNISHNKISDLPEGLFQHIISLSHLDLSYNELVHLPRIFLPRNNVISVINLHSTKLYCDCGVTDLLLTMRRPNVKVIGVCAGPHQLKGIALIQISLKSACMENDAQHATNIDEMAANSSKLMSKSEQEDDASSEITGNLQTSRTDATGVKSIHGIMESTLFQVTNSFEQALGKIINGTIKSVLDRVISGIIEKVLQNVIHSIETALTRIVNGAIDSSLDRTMKMIIGETLAKIVNAISDALEIIVTRSTDGSGNSTLQDVIDFKTANRIMDSVIKIAINKAIDKLGTPIHREAPNGDRFECNIPSHKDGSRNENVDNTSVINKARTPRMSAEKNNSDMIAYINIEDDRRVDAYGIHTHVSSDSNVFVHVLNTSTVNELVASTPTVNLSDPIDFDVNRRNLNMLTATYENESDTSTTDESDTTDQNGTISLNVSENSAASYQNDPGQFAGRPKSTTYQNDSGYHTTDESELPGEKDGYHNREPVNDQFDFTTGLHQSNPNYEKTKRRQSNDVTTDNGIPTAQYDISRTMPNISPFMNRARPTYVNNTIKYCSRIAHMHRDFPQLKQHDVFEQFINCMTEDNEDKEEVQLILRRMCWNSSLQNPRKFLASIEKRLANAAPDDSDIATELGRIANAYLWIVNQRHRSANEYDNNITFATNMSTNYNSSGVVASKFVENVAYPFYKSVPFYLIVGWASGFIMCGCLFVVHHKLQGWLFKKHHLINIV